MKYAVCLATGGLLLAVASPVQAVGGEPWSPTGQEIEFGISAWVGGELIDDPWIFESGYNGAWWSDPTLHMGQSFIVDSSRVLDSATLRVSRTSGATGMFAILVAEFDEESATAGAVLAYSLADAEDYPVGLTGIPQATFDLSSFGAPLEPEEAYLLVTAPQPGFSGKVYVQAATDIYPGGQAYSGWIPEPSTLSLLTLAALLIARRRR